MKKLTALLTILSFASATMAQDLLAEELKSEVPTVKGSKFCVSVNNGSTVVMSDGKPMSTATTLEDGAQLTSDGKVLWKDNSTTQLKEGYCIDQGGTLYVNNKSARNDNQ